MYNAITVNLFNINFFNLILFMQFLSNLNIYLYIYIRDFIFIYSIICPNIINTVIKYYSYRFLAFAKSIASSISLINTGILSATFFP